jgi:hypothetical protein
MSSILSKIWDDLNEDIRQLALRKLGPLAHFLGNWKGTGYTIISRPDAENGQLFKFQQNTTIEQMAFVPVIAPVLNRSAFADQKNISLKGLFYEQLVLDATDLTNILHFEIGQWIWVPETTNPANKASVARQANILHGTSSLAMGQAPDQVPVLGRPEISDTPTRCTKVIDHVKFSVSAHLPVTESKDQNHELYRPELRLTRQGSCTENGLRVADVVVWEGGTYNVCFVDPR